MIYTIVRKDKDDKIDAVISFDSITSMDEAWSATVTSQTVEYGFNISDNINIEAPTYSISAMISSYSLFDLDKEIVWDGETFKSKGESDFNSHVRAREEIIKVFSDRSLVTLVESSANTSNVLSKNDIGGAVVDPEKLKAGYEELKSGYHKEIDNCIMTSLSISHPDSGTGAFYITMNLQKIVMADVAVAELLGDEKRPAVRPLMMVYTPTTSSSTTETGTVDPKTGLPVEGEDEVADEVVEGNYKARRKEEEDKSGYTLLKRQLDAKKQVNDNVNITGKVYSATRTGDGYRVIEGTDPWVLMKPPQQ